ncbi:uncharacterized protein CDAR_455061 [Caerostris darwini]|uniref:Uncharacterized protein n=1 Tax=Caerostris darwini TaxID=1538125 RepID=A0AAV4R9X3_9ARAC|nr:uncharacterized protein CDAR_455061 [Caerostris darwini]
MIESSIMSSSVWNHDFFQDYNAVEVPLHSDFNDVNDSFIGDSSLNNLDWSNQTSSSSSDYEIIEGLDDRFDSLYYLSDAFVSEILDNDTAGFSNLDQALVNPDSSKKEASTSTFASNTNVQKNAVDYLLSSKLWSCMSSEEQLNTLHALSEVTCQMSICEQMEIIKIIDPTAIISPDDKEFALDSAHLNDEKFKKIINLILRMKPLLQNSSKSSKKTNSSSKLNSRKDNSGSYPKTKRKSTKKQSNILFPTEDKKKRLKRQRQTRKERKSGFFVYEKKVVINRVLEDEDINILE